MMVDFVEPIEQAVRKIQELSVKLVPQTSKAIFKISA